MVIFDKIEALRRYLKLAKDQCKSIGLVPTMGAIHEGHLTLIRRSVVECDVTVATIFVNPTQFNQESDLIAYPRTFEKDKKHLEEVECDVLFAPNVEEIYPKSQNNQLDFSFGMLEKVMEGKFRPGHFSGVGQVVCKFFNIVAPDKAYFGQKDLQQLAVIKMMVDELNIPVEVVGVETIREESGLAMSSRNMRLSEEGQLCAASLYKELLKLKNELSNNDVLKCRQNTLSNLKAIPEIEIEYLEVVDSETMEIVTEFNNHKKVSACIAAAVEGVRLIDNIYLK